MTKRRIDHLLVERGCAESRQKAQAIILAGQVLVDEQKVEKPGQMVAPGSAIRVIGRLPFVSRAGVKLRAALDCFQIPVAGRFCADLGASTGGFTDCLLKRGAARVYAVDVGKGQLDWGLRNDRRVVVMEGINAREGFDLPEPVAQIVADVSFISLRLALVPSLRHLREGGDVVALVKPQFEAGRDAVGRGGIVRDPAARAAAVVAVAGALAAGGAPVVAVVPSRVPGREGNREIFVHARRGATGLDERSLRAEAERAAQ